MTEPVTAWTLDPACAEWIAQFRLEPAVAMDRLVRHAVWIGGYSACSRVVDALTQCLPKELIPDVIVAANSWAPTAMLTGKLLRIAQNEADDLVAGLGKFLMRSNVQGKRLAPAGRLWPRMK